MFSTLHLVIDNSYHETKAKKQNNNFSLGYINKNCNAARSRGFLNNKKALKST